VVVWGTGTPRREFLHVDDMADACVHILSLPEVEFVSRLAGQDKPLVNIGTGTDCAIAELAQMVKEVVGFNGTLVFDSAKPEGTPQKLLDVSRVARLDWRARISLRRGIGLVYRWYEQKVDGKGMA
jgi:GDP-L-fucose synthase